MYCDLWPYVWLIFKSGLQLRVYGIYTVNFSFFQGAIGDTTAAQAVLTINGVQNNPGHGNIFGGTVLGNIQATAAKSNSKPGAVIVTGKINYRFSTTERNLKAFYIFRRFLT